MVIPIPMKTKHTHFSGAAGYTIPKTRPRASKKAYALGDKFEVLKLFNARNYVLPRFRTKSVTDVLTAPLRRSALFFWLLAASF